jgi:hypothetical protein
MHVSEASQFKLTNPTLMVCTQLLLLWLHIQASSCLRPFTGTLISWLLGPLLAGRRRCPPGYGNNNVNQITDTNATHFLFLGLSTNASVDYLALARPEWVMISIWTRCDHLSLRQHEKLVMTYQATQLVGIYTLRPGILRKVPRHP